MMRDGIVKFGEGVSRAIENKAREKGISYAAQVSQERRELEVLERLIQDRVQANRYPSRGLRDEAFLGLVSVARYLLASADAQPGYERDRVLYRARYLGGMIRDFEEKYEALGGQGDHGVKAQAALELTLAERMD
jgi:hypothetical protein